MPGGRVELPCPYGRYLLKIVRLPIPPPGRFIVGRATSDNWSISKPGPF